MMKKVFLLAAIAAVSSVAIAQPRAIGARLGYGVEVSYQHALEQNMVSAELSFLGFHSVGAFATYNWLNPGNSIIPWTEKGSWNWYAGVGAGMEMGLPAITKTADYQERTNSFSVGVAGRIGIEYDFWFPLQLSIDYRPYLGPVFSSTTHTNATGSTTNHQMIFNANSLVAGTAFAISARYLF